MARSFYLDTDVAYVLGLLVARGKLRETGGLHEIEITFPGANLQAMGEAKKFHGEREVRLEMENVRQRVGTLMGGHVETRRVGDGWCLLVRLFQRTVAWRNLLGLLGGRTGYEYFQVPEPLLGSDTPQEYKKEFIRGFADVAGNIRVSNRDRRGHHRVRLDVLNYATNWTLPVQVCQLLQEGLHVAVPNIIWGHPNMGRQWREHQINIYAEEFLKVGFSFGFKQQVLEELAKLNQALKTRPPGACPGERGGSSDKEADPGEGDERRLPPELLNRHFNSYWEICRALGCTRRPAAGEPPTPEPDE